MNWTLILLVAGVLFVLLVIIGVISVSLRKNSEQDDDPLQARLAEYLQSGEVASLEEIELSQPFSERVIIPIVNKIGEISARFTPQKAIQDTAKKMELAGNPWPIDAATFLAIRFIMAVVLGGFVTAMVMLSPAPNFSDNALYIFGATFGGFFLPHLMLTSRITNRQKEIRKAMPDAVLLDWNMPVMTGEEMIGQMRERADLKTIPTIVVSTEGSQPRIERLKNQGLKFIHKPFSPEKIRDTVKDVLGSEVFNEPNG